MLKKIINNPYFYFRYGIRIVYTIILFPFWKLVFKRIGFLSYVSPMCSVRNHNHIQLGNSCQINSYTVLWPSYLRIGNNCQINPGTAIYGKVKIGNNVMIAPNCMIAGGNHNFLKVDKAMISQGSNSKGIIIEDDVWIGANSVLVDGIKIGKGAIVGAGSVVVKNVESYEIVVGVPAIKVKSRK